MGELTALLAALCFGTTHFAGGMLSRRAAGMTISLYAQVGGTVLSVAAALVFGGPATAQALAWGALSGLGTGVGVAFLYRGMGRGAMSVVVPVSDLGAVAVPAAVAVLALGERLSVPAAAGIVLALPSVWLVSRTGDGHGAAGVADALVAGAGFAVQFLAMARVPADAGFWPIAVSRAVSVCAIVPLVLLSSAAFRLPGVTALKAAAVGALGSVAILLYWYVTHRQLVAVATVLTALYPAIPVVLAMLFLRERARRTQVAGLLGAGAAVGLIAVG